MARGRHYAKLSLSNAARLSFSDLCILLFMFLSLCRLCVCVFLCSHWSLVDVPLIFFCPADHVPDWQPRVLLGMVEARSVNVKKTTTTTYLPGGGLPVVMMAGDPRGSRLLHWARPWSAVIPEELHSCCLYRIIFTGEVPLAALPTHTINNNQHSIESIPAQHPRKSTHGGTK